MKFVMILILGVSVPLAFANEGWKNMSLAQKKQHMISKYDQKIEYMQEARNCIANAKDEIALKQCKEEKREAMEDIKGYYRDQKEEKFEQKEEEAKKRLEKEEERLEKDLKQQEEYIEEETDKAKESIE